MEKLLQRIQAFLAQADLPIYGMAPSSPLETEPPGYRPSDLLPGSRSVFCLGIPVPRGVFQSGSRAESTYWRTASVTYRYLDAILTRCAAMLEEGGDMAVPVFGCFPYDLKSKGDFWGYLNLVRMAEVAGLGKQGKNGLLVSSQGGTRLLLGGIVTTASLPSLSSLEGRQMGCPEGCFACQEACPVQAIDRDGRVDRLKCVRRSMRSPLFVHLLKSGEVKESDMEMVNHVSGVDDHSMYTCMACVAACPLG